MSYAYIVISALEAPTLILGVWSTRKRARAQVAKLLHSQEFYEGFAAEVYDETRIDIRGLSTAELSKTLFDSQELRDILADDLQVSVEKVKIGTLFNFTPWLYWDEENLYNALNMILKGEFDTVLPWGIERNRLLFRSHKPWSL